MGKKKGKERTYRGDDDIDLTGPSCRHIKKGIDTGLLKKLSVASDWTNCQDCKTEEVESQNEPCNFQEDTEPPAVWICLKCGHRGCGRNSENQHAIKHSETPRSEPHCLVVSMDNWNVWCYICDDDVQYSTTGQLAQLLTSLRKQLISDAKKMPQTRLKDDESSVKEEPRAESVASEEGEVKDGSKEGGRKESPVAPHNLGAGISGSMVSVKGLSNLGNTCFFNAVIQNLSQTQLLRQTLGDLAEASVRLSIDPGASSHLEPMEVQLEQPGSLTLAMCQLLNEIQHSKKGVVTPRELFTQVCKKAARFKGFQQQDSQELLRYLLDGMRAEEFKRVSSAMVDALKHSGKAADADELKTLIKEYEKKAVPHNFVDRVFGGEMTSTIMCQQCKTVSVVTEMFLDLSLPVFDEAYRKKNQRKTQKSSESSQDGKDSAASITGEGDDIISGTGSKYQQKKAKKQAKKQAKHQRRQLRLGSRITLDSLISSENMQQERDSATVRTEEESPLDDHGLVEQEHEQPQNDDIAKDDEEDDSSEIDRESSAGSSSGGRFAVLTEEQDLKGEVPDTVQSEEEVKEDAQLADEVGKISLDDALVEDPEAEGMDEKDKPAEDKEYTVVSRDPELAFHPLAERTAPDMKECSVQSCLFHFSEVETLSQTNRLQCQTCTKRAGEPKKSVYTEALKQMLISSPPPVLTLHLKRFQQNGYSLCKVNRHVQFPLILDLAPYCAAQCKNVADGGSRVLYSLYGLVEHSGTMRSGHYTAYVKTRPRHPFPPPDTAAAEEDFQPPRGSWFHISDTSVHPVLESKVQSTQAYLLFYERIL